MSTTKKILSYFGLLSLVAVLAVGVFMYKNEPQTAKGYSRILQEFDILGTGTSTAKTYNFTATAATTSPDSAIVRITEATDIFDIDIYPEFASSTAHVQVQVVKSSMPRCSNGSASNRWVDTKPTMTTSGASVTATAATTTYYFKPTAADLRGTPIQLTNLNADCLRVYIGGQAVTLYVTGTSKALSF